MNKKKLIQLKTDILPLALLFILPIIYLSGALFSSSKVLGSPSTDLKSFFFTKIYSFNSIAELSIPFWNPYVFGGMPFMATIHPAIFYPFNIICAVLPIVFAINWSIAFHLFLSAAFTYYLLKYHGADRFGAATAGIVYAFSAPQIMHIYAGHLIVLAAMVWTPLMSLFLERFIKEGEGKYGIFLSLTVAIQLLAGYPQYLFYSLIMISLQCIVSLIWLRMDGINWSKIWPKGLAFAGFISLGLAMSAVQILPTAEMTKYSTRENLSYEWISIFSFPPENLLTLLIPDFFGDMLKTPYWGKNYLWEMTAYVGIMPLLLAMIAVFYVRRRVVWFFAGVAIVSIILAMGKYTPLLEFLYNYVPGFHLFRGNSKFIFITALSMAVLSGFGADALTKSTDGLKKAFKALIIGFGVVMAAGTLIIYTVCDEGWFRWAINRAVSSSDFYSNPAPFLLRGFESVAVGSFYDAILWAIGLIIAGTAVLLLYSYGKLKEKVLMATIIMIIVFDLFTFGMRYMVTFDSREVYWDKDVVNFLKQDKEPFRVIAPEMAINSGAASGIEILSGYDTIMVKRYSEIINFSQGASPDEPMLWLDIRSVNKLTDLLNAKYLILESGWPVNNPAFRTVFDDGRYRIYQNLNALPRAFVVHGYKIINGRDGIFKELESPGFNPALSAITEEEVDGLLNSPSAKSPTPSFISYSPNRITIEAYLTAPGLFVLGDIWYPGWKAFVDGKETKIYRTNYVMRGVALSEGRHRVEFRYDPLSFKIGGLISLTSLIFVTAFLIWDWRRREIRNRN